MKCSERATKELRGTTIHTEHDVLDMIAARIGEGAQVDMARQLGISPAYLSDMLRGRRTISVKLARRLGLRRVTLFLEEGTK